MVKKKSSKKKVSYNNKKIVIGVIVLVILFVFAFAYQGSREDEEGLGQTDVGMFAPMYEAFDLVINNFIGKDKTLKPDDDNGDDDGMDGDGDDEMDDDDYYDMDGELEEIDDEILCDGNGEPEGCEVKKCPNQKYCLSYDEKKFRCCDLNEQCTNSKFGDRSKVWCSKKASEIICPGIATTCTNGEGGACKCTDGRETDGVICCQKDQTCYIYTRQEYSYAWCGPKDKKACNDPKKPFFCDEGKDTTCCATKSECINGRGGYSWCDINITDSKCGNKECTHYDPTDSKEENSGSVGPCKCGYGCCSSSEVCEDIGYGPDKCSAMKCPAGKKLCAGVGNGYTINICCNVGKCITGRYGNPSCSDGVYQ